MADTELSSHETPEDVLESEIRELEKRIAGRRAELRRDSHLAGRKALNGLASPAALVTAVAVGFAAGGGLRRKRRNGRNGNEHGNGNGAGKATGIASLLMTGATWFIRAQFGSPAGLARAVLQKVQSRRISAARPPLR